MHLRSLVPMLLLPMLAACEPTATPTKPDSPATTPGPAASVGATPQASGAPAAPSTADKPVPVQAGGPSGAAITASNAFSADLYSRLAATAGNFAYSPVSISIALSMTYAGARTETAAQMRKVLHLPEGQKAHEAWATAIARWQKMPEGYEMATANRLFGEASYKFEAPFLDLTKQRYGAPLEPRDFKNAPAAQRTHINGWVAGQTRDRIKDLIPRPAITADTRLVLVNALYLKASWIESFKQHMTKDGDFFANGKKAVKVPMMNRTAIFSHGAADGVKMLELPYKRGEMSMLIVMPEAKDGLPAVEKELTTAKLQAWLGVLKAERVWLTLPKFKVDPPAAIDLADHLKEMGMPLAFVRGKADFTGITNPASPADRLNIGYVFHKAFVEIDENGTEAAAATAVVMPRAGSAAPAEPARFVVDRPFLFFIRDKRNEAILFVGRVVDPSKS